MHTLSTVSKTTIIQPGEALQMLEVAYIQKKEKRNTLENEKNEKHKQREKRKRGLKGIPPETDQKIDIF